LAWDAKSRKVCWT
jgi:hypothetical protein